MAQSTGHVKYIILVILYSVHCYGIIPTAIYINNLSLSLYNSFISILLYHNDARSPSAQISRYHNDTGTRAQLLGPTCSMFCHLIYYDLWYYNYSLIISSYHNYVRSPSAQIPRHHNDPGTRAQLLGPNVPLFKLN